MQNFLQSFLLQILFFYFCMKLILFFIGRDNIDRLLNREKVICVSQESCVHNEKCLSSVSIVLRVFSNRGIPFLQSVL